MIAPREITMNSQLRIIIGILFTLLTCVPLAVVAYNDLGPGFGLAPNSGKTVMERRADSLAGKEIEVGADIYAQYCTACHGKKGEGIPQLAPPINRKDLLDGRRQKEIGWAGSVEAFLKNTLAAGRPVQSRPDIYAARMPTWSQEFGGPLRPDQIDSVVAFVLNWKDAAPEVVAYAPPGTPLPTPTPGPSPTPAPPRAGVIAQCQNMPAQFLGKKSPYAPDDRAAIAAGKQTYDNVCSACHGTTGKGDGAAAAALSPKPANFNDLAFMNGMPVDCHFWRISEGGGPGNPMPAWRALGDDAIWKVLTYERSFSGVK
jgi:mono/diheme cytochrome c family protein